jgi:hypothetical protein
MGLNQIKYHQVDLIEITKKSSSKKDEQRSLIFTAAVAYSRNTQLVIPFNQCVYPCSAIGLIFDF